METNINLNINRMVKFKLTKYGEELLKNKQSYIKHIKNNEYSSELWVFMSVFGEYIYHGGKQIIDENILSIDTTEYIKDGFSSIKLS